MVYYWAASGAFAVQTNWIEDYGRAPLPTREEQGSRIFSSREIPEEFAAEKGAFDAPRVQGYAENGPCTLETENTTAVLFWDVQKTEGEGSEIFERRWSCCKYLFGDIVVKRGGAVQHYCVR